MEKSVLGSAVKTYGGKNRYSRSSYSYRPSGLIGSQNIFDDDDLVSPFDKLLYEEKSKLTFVKATPLKSTFNGTINTKTIKLQSQDQRSNPLKSVQNVRNDSVVASTKSSTVHKFYGSNKGYANKENTLRCKNQLFLSDSDSSENDVFDYSKTVCKKGATTTKKRKKKDLGLKNASRAINQSDKRKRRLEYREKCRNKSLTNSSSSKCSFVQLDADGYGIPVRRRTLVVDRKSLLSFAKPLDEGITESEDYISSFKSMFAGIKKYAEKLENSVQSASISKDSASSRVPADTISATSSRLSSCLSPTHNRDSFITDFCPVQISTPRQSAKYDFRHLARSPMLGNSLGGSKSIEFDPTNPSKSLQFIKNRLSGRCKESSLCEVFEKSCTLITKQSESVYGLENAEQPRESPSKIVSGSSDTGAEKVNVSGETNYSPILMDAKDCSCNVSSQPDFEIFSANNSFEKTQKNDETESHYMSIESSSVADYSKSNITVEMKSLELVDPDGHTNASGEISRDLFEPRSQNSNSSSDFSDSANEKFDTIVQRAEVSKSAGCESNRNSAFLDSILLSVLHPSSTKSSVASASFRSSTASYLPSTLRSQESIASSHFSDSTNEKFETIMQGAEISKSTGNESNRNSAYIDSMLLSVLHPSSTKSSIASASHLSSTVRSQESNASSDFSDSTNEKFETIMEKAEISKSTGSESNRNSAYIDSMLLSVLHPSSTKSSLASASFRSSAASYFPPTEPSSARTSFSSPTNSRYSMETASICPFAEPHSLAQLSPIENFPRVPSSRLHLESTPDSSYLASHRSFSESSVNVSPCSSQTSPSSDSPDSDELTVLEKERLSANDMTSPEFAGFERTIAGDAKLAAFKGELAKLQNRSSSLTLSPTSGSGSLSNDSGIADTRRVERSARRSIDQEVMSYSRRRYSGILRKEASGGSRKSVRIEAISKFEPLLEEKAEDSPENDKEVDSCPSMEQLKSVHQLQSRGHFTERRRKRCPLPTLSEDTETDEGFVGSQHSVLDRISSIRDVNQTQIRSPIFLTKGKKWRRSFLMLKNVRDFGFNPDLSEEEHKGRCWRQNVEQLIQSQLEATVLPRELDECTVLRTGFDGKTTSGFEEGDTLTEKSIYSRRSRFSLSIRVDRPSYRPKISRNSLLDESSLARLALESRESFLADVNVSAGDHFRNCSLPRIDFGVPHTAREIVLRYCQQSQPLPFDECFDESVLRSCRKIGEGVYGEVFALKTRSKSSVIKIIPIEGDQKVNGERQKRFDEILSELVISLELSNLRRREDYYTNCFAQVQRCWCVQGRYPTRLITLWREYDEAKGSDNDSPKIFKDDQLYIILELNNGGEDLESFEFNNAQQTLSVFKQVANALAVAEQAFKFEHRDLHWGNILISPTKDREASFIFGDKTRSVQLFGVKVTIIDYTLSRISLNDHTLYNNIGEDPELFTAEGDFQFEVYRLMRKEVDDIWDRYVPKTNVIWLYYLIDKMINEVRYRRDYTKIHQTNVEKLKRLHASVLNFESSCDLVENQPI